MRENMIKATRLPKASRISFALGPKRFPMNRMVILPRSERQRGKLEEMIRAVQRE